MSKECDIVRDLIPLYEENLLSEASKAYVEEHLKDCMDCQSSEDNIPINANHKESDIKEIKSISYKIKKHYLNVGLLVLMIVAICTTIVLSTLAAPKYYSSSSRAIEVVEKNGQVIVSFSPEVTRYDLSYSRKENSSMYNYTIGVYYTKLDHIMNKGRLEPIVLNVNDEKVHFVYQYSPYDKEDEVIYGNKTIYDGGKTTLARLAQNYYLVLALGVWAITLVAIVSLLVIRKSKRVLNGLSYLFALVSTYIMIHVVYFASYASSYLLKDALITVVVLTLLLYLVELIVYKLFLRINKA